MKNENKIVELLTEVLLRQDRMAIELGGVKSEVDNVKSKLESEVGSIRSELGNVKSEIVKLNLQTAENTRTILKLSDRIEQVVDHEKRISNLEKVAYK